MNRIDECYYTENANLITRSEMGKEISFKNDDFPLVCDVASIENCVLSGNNDGKRCDYLFCFDRDKQEYKIPNLIDNSQAYYVELKGIDISEACEQLHNSIEKTSDQLPNYNLNAIVVASREFAPRYDEEFSRKVYRLIGKPVTFKVLSHTVKI
jgi:hypothetical protein